MLKLDLVAASVVSVIRKLSTRSPHICCHTSLLLTLDVLNTFSLSFRQNPWHIPDVDFCSLEEGVVVTDATTIKTALGSMLVNAVEKATTEIQSLERLPTDNDAFWDHI